MLSSLGKGFCLERWNFDVSFYLKCMNVLFRQCEVSKVLSLRKETILSKCISKLMSISRYVSGVVNGF